MREHLKGIADLALTLVGPKATMALDIGCNDGTLLACYPNRIQKFGIDPSNAVEAIAGDVVVVQDRFPSQELTARIGERGFDIITSIAMFYDLEDPIAFVRGIRDALAPGGIWIFEMSYMPSMLRTNSYDTICHEHIEYYSLAAIEFVLAAADMKLFGASLNDINGGSIRCYASHAANFNFRGAELSQELGRLRRLEFDLALDTDKPYRDFQAKVEQHRDELTRLIKDFKRAGKRVHVYGASTKGNVILQFCAIDNSLIDFAADRNPDKWGARTIGTDIPIISEEESRRLAPDYYLVLPWHFRSEFLEREHETLKRGTKFIFPLPDIEVVEGP
jgi:SAM-dependent methyltransferase